MPRSPGYRSVIDVEAIVTSNSSLVSTGSCAALVQHYSRVGRTSNWKEGARVRGTTVQRGTAIATFVDGEYPNKASGNHAAFYISQDMRGIWVVDQWESLPKPHKRHIRFNGTNADGSYKDPSNNGDALSIILL